MKAKKHIIAAVVILLALALLFGAYQLFRFPALLRHLTDHSLPEAETEALKNSMASLEDKKALVAYFSYSGTTKHIAETLSAATGADLFEIRPQTPYSNVYLESHRELRRGARPALAGTVSDMAQYDVIFVGYPVWFHATPAPVNTFLESYDLTGKLIIPFCTSASSDIAETMPTFLDSCGGLAVYGGRRLASAGDVGSWLNELALDFRTPAAASQEDAPGDEAPQAPILPEEAPTPADGAAELSGKVLVVYFSWSSSGNTEKMASFIHSQTGGDLLRLEPAEPYPTDYNETAELAKAERDENARPAIANLPDSIEAYDTVLIGYPI